MTVDLKSRHNVDFPSELSVYHAIESRICVNKRDSHNQHLAFVELQFVIKKKRNKKKIIIEYGIGNKAKENEAQEYTHTKIE